MNELQKVFNYADNYVRTIVKKGEPWFVAKDIAKILELDTTATRRLEDDEKIILRLTQGETNRSSNTTLINEAGLYTLILGSRKPEAKQFKRWITHVVIPSIRKHGAYITGNTVEQMLNNPDHMIALLTKLKEEQQKRTEAERNHLAAEEQSKDLIAENSELKPKARKYEEFLKAEGLTTLTLVGKHFLRGLTAIEVRKFLQRKGVLFLKKVNGAYVPKKGYEKYFSIIPYTQTDGSGITRTVNNTLKVTNEGINFIIDLYEQECA